MEVFFHERGGSWLSTREGHCFMGGRAEFLSMPNVDVMTWRLSPFFFDPFGEEAWESLVVSNAFMAWSSSLSSLGSGCSLGAKSCKNFRALHRKWEKYLRNWGERLRRTVPLRTLTDSSPFLSTSHWVCRISAVNLLWKRELSHKSWEDGSGQLS